MRLTNSVKRKLERSTRYIGKSPRSITGHLNNPFDMMNLKTNITTFISLFKIQNWAYLDRDIDSMIANTSTTHLETTANEKVLPAEKVNILQNIPDNNMNDIIKPIFERTTFL